MKARQLVFIAALGAVSSLLSAQDSRSFDVDLSGRIKSDALDLKVDFKRARGVYDLPLLVRYHTDDTVWLALGASTLSATPPRDKNVPTPLSSDDLGFRERWLMKSLKDRVKGITAADTVEKLMVRHDGTSRTIASEKGIEVKGSAEALAQARDFFDVFTAGSKKIVTIEVRVVELEAEARRSDLKTVAEVTARAEYDKRLKALTARGGGNIVHSPVVKVFANQTATLALIQETSYIKDYTLEVVQDQKIADPTIGVVNDGFEMEVTPLFDPADGSLIVGGSIRLSKLERPIQEHRTKIGETDVTIQLPTVVSSRWNGEVKLAPGENAFVISGLMNNPPAGPIRHVEVWCFVTLEDETAALPAGEIVTRSDASIFVSFPREYVPDDPWEKAPKEVTIYRQNEKIGKAKLAGGWVLAEEPDPKRGVIAIYQVTEGTAQDGDTVR